MQKDPSDEFKENRGRKCTLDNAKLARLRKIASDTNPPTQQTMANRLKVSKNVVRYAIKTKTDLKLVKKPKVHSLSDAAIEKRRSRSWRLYCKLSGGKFENFITTDEAWFYLSDTGGERDGQYIKRSENRSSILYIKNARIRKD